MDELEDDERAGAAHRPEGTQTPQPCDQGQRDARTRPRFPAPLFALLSLGLLPACGGIQSEEPQENTGPALARILVSSDRAEEAEAKQIARYVPGDEEKPWRRRKDELFEVETSAEGNLVRVAFDTPTNIGVRADLRTTTFDRVDVIAKIPAGQSELLRVTLLEGGKRRALVSGIETVKGTGEFQTIRFPLVGIERLDVLVSDVTIQVVGDADETLVRSIEVLRQRAAALLPRPGDEPKLIDLGTDARRGWGLDPEQGARWTTERAYRANERHLRFSYATGPGLAGSSLMIDGLGGDDPIKLDLSGDDRAWKRFDRPVPALKKGAPVSFSIEGKSARHAPAAIAELALEAPQASLSTGELPEPTAPLVLLITSDTHRGDHVGRGGTRGLVSTPKIDALGRRGVQFTNAFSSANMTNPSHVALMTGESPRDTRIVGNQAPLDEAARTLAERFADAGWATAAAVSVHHICHPYSGLGQGFDRYDGPEVRTDYRNQRRPGAVAVERALAWMEERADVPLFLWVHVFDVHGPYEAEAPFLARYSGAAGEGVDPLLDPVPNGPLPDWILKSTEKMSEVRGSHNRYRAAVDQVDALLGQLFEHPRARLGESVVALTADHGESFGRHDLWWTHHGLYRDQIHVPLLLAGGGLPQGLQSGAAVEMLSLGATLLELAGLNAEEFPALPLDLLGERPPEPRFALGFSGHKAAIDHEGWLLILNLVEHGYELGPREFPKGGVELYHVEVDPACEVDLAPSETRRADRMRTALIKWLDDARPEGYATVFNMSPEAVQRLNELGYGGMTESPNTGRWYQRDE